MQADWKSYLSKVHVCVYSQILLPLLINLWITLKQPICICSQLILTMFIDLWKTSKQCFRTTKSHFKTTKPVLPTDKRGQMINKYFYDCCSCSMSRFNTFDLLLVYHKLIDWIKSHCIDKLASFWTRRHELLHVPLHVNGNSFQISNLLRKFKDWIKFHCIDKLASLWTRRHETLPLHINNARERLAQPLRMTEKCGRHDWEKTYYYDETAIGSKSIWSQGSVVNEVDELVTNKMENLRYDDDRTYLSPTNTPPPSPGGIY